MSLAENFNPDKSALLIASGNSIYVWAHDKPQPISSRPRPVNGLALLGDQVLDAGRYRGVRDTLSGKSVMGEVQRWRSIATHNDRVFGGLMTEDPNLFGVWEINTLDKVVSRNRTTRVLIGGPELLDTGDYVKPADRWHPRKYPEPDTALYYTLKDDYVLPTGIFGVHGGLIQDGMLYWGEFTSLNETELRPHALGYTSHFAVNDEFLDMSNQFSGVLSQFKRGYYDAVNAWGRFTDLFQQHKDSLPKAFQHMPIKDLYDQKVGTVKVEGMPFDQAIRHYEGKLNYLKEYYLDEGGELYLLPLLQHAVDYTWDHYQNGSKIQAVAEFEGQVVVGNKRGRLMVADRGLQESGEHTLWEFPKPIEALLTVPIEVYQDGIKQKVDRLRQQRAMFAKGQKPQTRVLVRAA